MRQHMNCERSAELDELRSFVFSLIWLISSLKISSTIINIILINELSLHTSTQIIGSPRCHFNHTVVKYTPKQQNSIMYFTFIPSGMPFPFHFPSPWMNKAYKKIHSPENKVIIEIKHYPISSYVAEYHQTDTPGHSIKKTNWKKHLYQIHVVLCRTSVCENMQQIAAHPTAYWTLHRALKMA